MHCITEFLKKNKLEDLFNIGEIELKINDHFELCDDVVNSSSIRSTIQWLDDRKAQNHILQKRVGLNTLDEWYLDNNGHFAHKGNKFFKVMGMNIKSLSREVLTWNQPIIDNSDVGIIGLLIQKISKTTYFLMQAKAEPGNRNIVQFAPTVQFTPRNYVDSEKLHKPFFFDEFTSDTAFLKVLESKQAEEGGRFYKKSHTHKILEIPENLNLDIPPMYRWLDYNQIRFFLHFGDFINSCARSIFCCLL